MAPKVAVPIPPTYLPPLNDTPDFIKSLPAAKALDDNTIIALFYPKAVTIKLQGATSCVQFGAYHNNITLDAAHGNRHVAYAVMPNCTFPGMNQLETMTSSASQLS